MRILKSHSILSKGNDYLVDSPQQNNLRYLLNFGSLLAMCLVINIFFTIALYIYFDFTDIKIINSIEHIMRNPSNKLIEVYILLNIVSLLILLTIMSILKKLKYKDTISVKFLKSKKISGNLVQINTNFRYKQWDFFIRIYILLGIKLPSCFLLLTLNMPVIQIGIICAILSIVLSKFRRGDIIGYYEFFGILLCSCIISIIFLYFEPSKSVLNIVLSHNTILCLKSYIPLDIFDSILAYLLASVEISPHFNKVAIPAGVHGINSKEKTLKDYLHNPFNFTRGGTDTSNSGQAGSGSGQSRGGNPGMGSRSNIGQATNNFHWFEWFMDRGIARPGQGITNPNQYISNPGRPLNINPGQLPPRLGIHFQPPMPVHHDEAYPPITGYHCDRNGVWNNSLQHDLQATPPNNDNDNTNTNVQKEGPGSGPPNITGSVVEPRPNPNPNPNPNPDPDN